ncbi:MAG: exodeoxyribonuclease V subunit beta [Pseudomonadota bacterium]
MINSGLPPHGQTTAKVLTAKQTLQLDLFGVKLIEASAGTGKTYAISNLYLRYVLAGRRVSEILVVTFTNAATEELRGRIRARLHDALHWIDQIDQEPQDEFLALLLEELRALPEVQRLVVAMRLRLAVRSMDEATIYTINGFCQRALTDHAFSSGQPFELELVSDDDELWEGALKDWWRSAAYELDEPDLKLFLGELGSLEQFLKSQRALRHIRDTQVLPQSDEDMPALYARWRAQVTPLQTLAKQWQDRADELRDILMSSPALSRAKNKGGYQKDELAVSLALLDAYFRSSDLRSVPTQLQLLSAGYVRDYQLKKDDPALRDPFFLECQIIVDELNVLRKHFGITALLDATASARVRVERVKALTRTISFNDQLTRLHDALLGPSGIDLVRALQRSFPVAMIDEFQDTDRVQYHIFRELFLLQKMSTESVPDKPAGLILIGDPKQAIYSFRGGDIFVYAEARKDAGENRYTLDTNWRSTPPLVHAVNTVFRRREAPFIYARSIDFHPVQAAAKKHEPLIENGVHASPMTFWRIPRGDDGKPLSLSEARRIVSVSVAEEIARLVEAGARGEVRLGEEPLLAGDVAVLVRTNDEGAGLREALLKRGLSAVTVGRDNVFKSAEAAGLELLLTAVVHCSNRAALRAALTSDLLDLDYTAIARIVDDPQRWLQWTERLQTLQRLWLQKGFMTMFQSLLQETLPDLQIGLQLAALPYAERRLTNLMHLGELLQQTARTHPGLESLLSWYREQILDTSEAETELRLESDEALVKIVTIHASKGLEYPVVFVPFLWACRPRDLRSKGHKSVAFHDLEGNACLDLGSEHFDEHAFLAESERLAEDVRLAYVALTRARAKIYLAWGVAQDHYAYTSRTALAWLLHSQQTPADLQQNFPKAALDADQINAALDALVAQSNGTIALEDLPQESSLSLQNSRLSNHEMSVELCPALFSGRIATDWRITSFSSLTRDIHQAPHAGSNAVSSDPILTFAAGSHVGLFLHHLLEHLDFQGDIQAQGIELNKRFALRFGFDARRQQDTVVVWLHNIVSTPLNDAGLRLSQLSRRQRLDELEFDFAIDHVRVDVLNRILNESAGVILSPVTVEDFRGMITGIIDLVFEHDGRYYIADYKSNLLGTQLDDYTPDKLRKAIFDRRYDLQYLLYVLALHRYLRQRVRGYAYSQHIGGVYYLFLRGLRPASGPRYGVYHELPDQALIETLDQQVFAYQRVDGEASSAGTLT